MAAFTKNTGQGELTVKKVTLICVLFIFLLTACASAENTIEQEHHDSLTEGYEINNEPIHAADIRYSIEELKSFFMNRSVVGSDCGQYTTLCLDEMDQQFPIVYLRKMQGEEGFPFYYVAYPVLEGGNFLVLLSEVVDPDSREQDLGCWSTFYTRDLPDKDCFAELEAGASLGDVIQIAPYTEQPVMSSANISYSLLKDGSTMKCTYARPTDQGLILESTELLEIGDPRNPFAWLLHSDLAG